ncbi:hypothetical protein EPUS_02388 [Endocarpon pusillum Z07020]|uniref:MARVEL domain-containing protein n=1 Tax=Endocarpon pusillum (strain Z07020 / HMAS-L-300199) TaxID=1263415 RepID=U1GGG2_ENDPU|nr:uncharacterized protein EPUS_02388 [Endocarpon pusillum Z07020]ERF70866.1 hypothetical protein EPUS_02388 [Endocarpon pusillum Z07020]
MARRNTNGVTSATTTAGDTGLLTRFVPESLKHTALYRWLLRLTRILQFLSATISLGIFSSRVYKVYRLVNSLKAQRGISRSHGAVEGILAAAVLYTLIAMLMSLLKKGGASKGLRWLFVLLDLAFVGAFIAVAVITSPNGGSAGPRRCYSNRNVRDDNIVTGEVANARDSSCNLPWGTFILSIISTILHAITAAFHEVRDRRHEQHRLDEEARLKHSQEVEAKDGYVHGGGVHTRTT